MYMCMCSCMFDVYICACYTQGSVGMYQEMTIKCQSVHLFTRTHDLVDAQKFQEMQKMFRDTDR